MVQSWHWALPQAASQPARVLPGLWVSVQSPVCSLQWHLGTQSPALPWLVPTGEWGILCLYSRFAEWQVSQQFHSLHVLDTNENYVDKQSLKQLGWLWVLDGLYHFWSNYCHRKSMSRTQFAMLISTMILINIKLKSGILNQIILRQLDVSLSLIIKTYTHAVIKYLVFIEL